MGVNSDQVSPSMFSQGERLFLQQEATLENGSSMDSGWINMEKVSKYQLGYLSSGTLSLVIESREADTGDADLSTPGPFTGEFYLAVLPRRQKWMRFIVTNSSGETVTDASLSLFAIYGGVDGASVFPIEISPSQFSPAMLTQSVLIGKDAFGVYRNTAVNESGALLTADFGTEAARGVYPAYEIKRKFGRNGDIGTLSDPEDVWNGGSVYTGFNATQGEDIEVFSADAADAGTLLSSGTATDGSTTTIEDTGATFVSDGVAVGDIVLIDSQGIYGYVSAVSETLITVFNWIDGNASNYTISAGDTYRVATAASTGAAVLYLNELLDSDLVDQTDAFVILNGVTPVTLSGDYMRCSTGEVLLSGSNQKNVGQITVRQATTTANVFCQLPLYARTTIGCFTVPSGKNAIIKRCLIAIVRASGAAGSATALLNIRKRGSNTFAARKVAEISTSSAYDVVDQGGIFVNSGADVKVTIDEVSDNGTIVNTEIEYYLIDEDQ